ncbi:MAG: esterase family protein [Planctomycetes bacterium]|nr:esterase family protein [Planctomycetota bacterium]
MRTEDRITPRPRLHAIDSRHLGERRPYRVLLPPGYDGSGRRRYPVLYLQDGQAAFDDDTNVLAELLGGRWPALDAGGQRIAGWIRGGAVEPFITVAVDALSIETRIRDYLPPGDEAYGVEGRADHHARFVVEELKPRIDASYPTLPGPESTAAAGFSFGGLTALYLAWERPDRFGAAGSISGAFWLRTLPRRIATEAARPLKIYIDSGDVILAENLELRDLLIAKGYELERTLRHVHRAGHDHVPWHFAEALGPMLSFLLPPVPAQPLPPSGHE